MGGGGWFDPLSPWQSFVSYRWFRIHVVDLLAVNHLGRKWLYRLSCLAQEIWPKNKNKINKQTNVECKLYRSNSVYSPIITCHFYPLSKKVLLHSEIIKIYRGYWMSVSSILNLLHELNKIILCETLASIILFYSTRAINSVMNLHEFNILLITYPI
jgi:hypothetical protein